MSKPIQLGLIGAGNRGQGIFGQYALDMPHRTRFVCVVEPDPERREHFIRQHQIDPRHAFASLAAWEQGPLPELDGVVIATLEDRRIEPIQAAMRKGLHILVEKPLCQNAAALLRLADATAGYDKILIVCHQMRVSPTYSTVKGLIDSGRYGRIVAVQHSENLSYSHMAHSFVRGLFNNDRLTPMLLAKSCHDLDILTHLTGKRAVAISSFGSLNYFRRENCPEGAPAFCLQGCPAYRNCPYDVAKLYFEPDTDPAYLRQMGVITSKEQLRQLLMHNRFGRCVFQCDNNVVDNQVVNIQLEDNITISFTMCGHNGVERRMTKISMTNGEIVVDTSDPRGTLRVYSFAPLQEETVTISTAGTHAGADRAIMDNFVDAITTGDHTILLTPISRSIEGHLLVFAAEESRRRGQVVGVRDYEAEVRRGNA